MASSNLQKVLLSTLLFLTIILDFPVGPSAQECPYPCYPPPTGTGNNPPVTTTPPSPPAGTSFSPPTSYNSPPSGGFPYFTPPGSVSGLAPPPPDPIVPWFPYYYRKPPHADQSSSVTLQGSSRIMIINIPSLVLILFSVFY